MTEGYGLTRREWETLEDVCWEGLTVAESAHKRKVGYQSVKNLLYVLYRVHGWRDVAHACTQHGAGNTYLREELRKRPPSPR